jgi:hypothetical protein
MKILVDECVPRQIIRFFPEHDIRTVPEIGWSGIKNGDLILQAEKEFDIFITSDQNIRYQQNLKNRKIAIIELSTNERDVILSSGDKIISAVQSAREQSYLEISLP